MDVLGIAGVETHKKLTFAGKRAYVLEARMVEKATECPRCHGKELGRHGKRELKFFDSPSGNFRVFIKLLAFRYQCRSDQCGHVFDYLPEELEQAHKLTARCLQYVAEESLKYAFRRVAENVGCDEHTVRKIAKAYVEGLKVRHPVYLPEWLGIDETHLGKGKGKEYCVFSDIVRRRGIDLERNTRGITVFKWLSKFPKQQILKGVTMDMTRRYRDAVRDKFPSALIVVDKFHVQDKAYKSLDDWRNKLAKELEEKKKKAKAEEKRLAKEGVKGEKTEKTVPQTWRRDRALIQQRAKKLGSMTRTILRDTWLKNEPELQKAYWLKEELFQIYDCETYEQAKEALDTWRSKVGQSPRMRQAFRKVMTCTKNWEFEILSYFLTKPRKTNAFAERLNQKAKAIYREGRRLKFPMLRAKLLYGHREKLGNARLYNSTATVRKQRNPCKRRNKRDDKMLEQIETCDNLPGVREKLVAQEGHKCHSCGAADPDDRLELHYGRLQTDSADEFMALCPSCHDSVHQQEDGSHKEE